MAKKEGKLEKELMNQIQKEFYSAYLYLSMAGYFEIENLPGFAHWMRVQSQEELNHGMKFFNLLSDLGVPVQWKEIPAPPTTYQSAVDAFEKALAHEKGVTQSIHRLYEMAVAEKHYPAMVLLHWFIEEQVEEEKIVEEILSQLRLGKGDPSTILILDKALKERK